MSEEVQSTSPDQVQLRLEETATLETVPQAESLEEQPAPNNETLSDEAEKEIQQQIESADDVRIVLTIMRQNSSDKDILTLISQTLTEKYGNNAPSLETLIEVSELMQQLELSISQSDLQKLTEMEKNPSFEGTLDKKNLIIDGLCLPVLKGHLTAEDVGSIVEHIALMGPPATSEENRASSGYEGVMFYDQENHTIIINPAIFAKKYRDKNGQFLTLDHEHMATHELSHGVAGKTVLAGENWQNLEKQLTAENPEFSSEMIKQIREIIESAEEIKNSQSIHIRNVLEAIKNIDQDYLNLPPLIKQRSGTREQFRNQRLAQAAIEIVTEYTALYLESDGSFKNFVRNCLIKTGKKGLEKFIASSLNISANSENEKKALVQKKMKSILTSLSNGSETISAILEQNPGLKRFFDCYKVFYDNIDPAVKESKGSLSEEGDNEFDMGDYDGYYDSASSFEQPGNSGQSSGIMAMMGAFGSAFANEVEITKPITG